MKMMKSRIILSLMLLIVLQLNVFAQDMTKTSNKKLDDSLTEVLVLCSYDYGMDWERDMVSSFTDTLTEQYRGDISVVVDFMDTKRYVSDTYNQQLESLLNTKYENNAYDVVYAIDNAALQYVNAHYQIMFKDALVVFAGINHFQEDMVNQIDHYYGVKEVIDYRQNIQLIKQTMDHVGDIYVINDNSLTGVMLRSEMNEDLSQSELDDLHFIETVDLKYVTDQLAHLRDEDVVLLLSFTKDMEGNTYTYEYMCDKLTQSTSAPVYAGWDFYLGHGVVGGYMASSQAHGRAAAEGLVKRLENPYLENEVVDHVGNRFMFDYTKVQQFGINTNSLPKDAVIINYNPKHMSLETLLVIVLVILFILVIAFVYMLNLFRRRNREHSELSEEAGYDYLTGVYNRRKGLAVLEHNIRNSVHKEDEYALIFFDLDGLKTINDHFGHNEGDEYIKDSVSLIKHFIRKDDVFLRYGGDEFILVLKHADLIVAERICSRIAASMANFNGTNIRRYKVSFSWGIETFVADEGTNIDMIINMADQKMYTAKYNKKAVKR